MPELRAKGVNAVVVVMHEGGEQMGGINECKDFKGPAKEIAARLPPEVSVVVTAHTHRFYICDVDGKRVTSAGSYGTLVTSIDMELDRSTGKVVRTSAKNIVVKPDGPKAPELTALVERYAALSEPLEKRVVATVKREVNAVSNPAGESPLGNLVADAHLFATASPDRGGAVIAFNNRGSLRAPIIPDEAGGVSYGALFKTQPFQNDLVVMNLSGAELKAVLEQQWLAETDGRNSRIMGVSTGFSYAWDASKPVGSRIVAGSMRLNGVPIRQDLEYRVAANSFVAGGAEGFTVFRDGRDRQVSVLDLDALVEYLAAKSPYDLTPLGTRIVRVN
jgi:5'-nucleotidase